MVMAAALSVGGSMAQEAATAGRSSLRRVILASAIGSALEWYDYFIYGTAAALVFGELFFPKLDPTSGTLAALATFGVGFVARPFGGLVFGHFGDRLGRKPVLVMTLILVGGGTALIGLLPTYNTVGVWAPALLVVLRLVQGFGAGAEYGGAVILAVEYAPEGRRGRYGSFAPMGVTAGNLLAMAVFALVSSLDKAQFLSWGWRIPFLLSFGLVALGVGIRARILETPVFAEVVQQRATASIPVLDAIRQHPRSFVVVIGARLAENGLGYLYPVFGLTYITATLHLPRSTALTGMVIATFVEIFAIAYFAALSDRIGRRPVYIGAALFSAAMAFPFFWLVDTKSPPLIFLALVLTIGIGSAGMFGPQAAYFAELFGPRLRYSGFAFARELGSILAGGPAPYVSVMLIASMDGRPWGVALYIILLSLLTAFAVFIGPETYLSDIKIDRTEAQTMPAPAVAL
jgi:MFS transporter, MHS family, shikimate and dehydroshikimate transport protein